MSPLKAESYKSRPGSLLVILACQRNSLLPAMFFMFTPITCGL